MNLSFSSQQILHNIGSYRDQCVPLCSVNPTGAKALIDLKLVERVMLPNPFSTGSTNDIPHIKLTALGMFTLAKNGG